MNRCCSANFKYDPVSDVCIFSGFQDNSSELNSLRGSDLFCFIVGWS